MVAPLASSPRKDTASLENFTELAAVPPMKVNVSPVVWICGLDVLIVASKGIDAGKPLECHEAWSEQP